MVYIVLLNYKGYMDTIECMRSLTALEYKDFKVIVIDTSPDNEIKSFIKPWSIREKNNNIVFIKSTKNRGYAAGNNIGIRKALEDPRCEYIWVLNNDTVVEKKSLSELVACMRERENIAVVGSAVMRYTNPNLLQSLGIVLSKVPFGSNSFFNKTIKREEIDLYKDIDYYAYNGASFLLNANFLRKYKRLLNEQLHLYYEEIDFCSYVKKTKWDVMIAFNSLVYHKGGNSTKKEERMLPVYESMRSKYIVIKNYFMLCLVTEICIDIARIAYNIGRLNCRKGWIMLRAMISGLIIEDDIYFDNA